MDPEIFEKLYEGQAPWDIGEPQPEIVRLAEQGAIQGVVLDVGCGTGENALYLAARGYDVWGIDFVPKAIERAREKALHRGLGVHFQVGDALKLDVLGRTFDTIIDSGLFHTFSDEERSLFVRGLARCVRPGGMAYLLCFSDQEPPGEGPHRINQEEIRSAFREWWEVESIRETRFKALDDAETPRFSPGGPRAYRIAVGAIRSRAPLSREPRRRDAMTTDPLDASEPDSPGPSCTCRRCGRESIPGQGGLYVVSVLAVADPSPPVFTADDLALDTSAEIRRLIKQLSGVDALEAHDQVYRRLVFHLCVTCYGRWIEEPTGSG